MKSIVAIIPARGGSKGIPGKNIKEICGKPLIAWSIIQAQESNIIESVWVSSDSDEILSVAERYGARKIKRPENISTDDATSESAWIHAIEQIEKINRKIDLVLGLQATSPIRSPKDIKKAYEVFKEQRLIHYLVQTK